MVREIQFRLKKKNNLPTKMYFFLSQKLYIKENSYRKKMFFISCHYEFLYIILEGGTRCQRKVV